MKYTENDEIELGLTGCEPYFELVWRFKKCRKFLFFKIHDKWHKLRIYCADTYIKNWDPDGYYFYYNICFNLDQNRDIAEYTDLKNKIITKKDLWDYYRIDARNKLYEEHKQKYNEYKHFLEENIKKLVLK